MAGQGEEGMDAEDEEHQRSTVFCDDTRSFGQVDNDEDSSVQCCIGSLDGRPARALQSRAVFLNGQPSYLLYFWEVADTHQLL